MEKGNEVLTMPTLEELNIRQKHLDRLALRLAIETELQHQEQLQQEREESFRKDEELSKESIFDFLGKACISSEDYTIIEDHWNDNDDGYGTYTDNTWRIINHCGSYLLIHEEHRHGYTSHNTTWLFTKNSRQPIAARGTTAPTELASSFFDKTKLFKPELWGALQATLDKAKMSMERQFILEIADNLLTEHGVRQIKTGDSKDQILSDRTFIEAEDETKAIWRLSASSNQSGSKRIEYNLSRRNENGIEFRIILLTYNSRPYIYEETPCKIYLSENNHLKIFRQGLDFLSQAFEQ